MGTSFIFWILFSQKVFSQTLIVSDIDDTVRISHVKNWSEAIKAPFTLGNEFGGMSSLYDTLLKDIPRSELHYVSNAPKPLMEISHIFFLMAHMFPEGGVYLRPLNDWAEHKFHTISSLINQSRAKKVFLFGDNGEEDYLVYKRIELKYSNVEFRTYIRRAYAEKIYSDQIEFVTPLEVAQDMYEKGELSYRSAQSYIQYILPQVLSGDKSYFPKWVNCRGYVWKNNSDLSLALDQARARIHKYCHK